MCWKACRKSKSTAHLVRKLRILFQTPNPIRKPWLHGGQTREARDFRHVNCRIGLHLFLHAMAAARFRVDVRDDIAVLVQEGAPLFDETTKALAAVINTSLKIGSKKIVIDARLSDLVNYYNYVVRHAELLPKIGFDGSFRSAIVGLPEQVDVMDFIVSVGRNRGWIVRRFLDMDEAMQWLRG